MNITEVTETIDSHFSKVELTDKRIAPTGEEHLTFIHDKIIGEEGRVHKTVATKKEAFEIFLKSFMNYIEPTLKPDSTLYWRIMPALREHKKDDTSFNKNISYNDFERGNGYRYSVRCRFLVSNKLIIPESSKE